MLHCKWLSIKAAADAAALSRPDQPLEGVPERGRDSVIGLRVRFFDVGGVLVASVEADLEEQVSDDLVPREDLELGPDATGLGQARQHIQARVEVRFGIVEAEERVLRAQHTLETFRAIPGR